MQAPLAVSALVSLKLACYKPHYIHYAVAYATYYYNTKLDAKVVDVVRTLSDAPWLQIDKCEKQSNTLYVVFGGIGSLTTASKYLKDAPRDACSIFVLQAAFKQVLGLPHKGWFEDTMTDIDGIMEYIILHQYKEIVGVGVSLGGLAASYFAKQCFLKLNYAFTFFYIGERSLNSELTAATTMHLNPLPLFINRICLHNIENDEKHGKTVLASLKVAYTKTSKTKQLKVGFIEGRLTRGDWLAGATTEVQTWVRHHFADDDYKIEKVPGGHQMHHGDVINDMLKYLGCSLFIER